MTRTKKDENNGFWIGERFFIYNDNSNNIVVDEYGTVLSTTKKGESSTEKWGKKGDSKYFNDVYQAFIHIMNKEIITANLEKIDDVIEIIDSYKNLISDFKKVTTVIGDTVQPK